MRLISLLLLPLLILANCRSEQAIEPVELSGCNDPKYSRAKQLQDVSTFVIAKTYIRADGSSFTTYYLDQPDAAGLNTTWAVCNLPDAYKKDKLAVRINGYTLTYPGMERENQIGDPIELTRISKLRSYTKPVLAFATATPRYI